MTTAIAPATRRTAQRGTPIDNTVPRTHGTVDRLLRATPGQLDRFRDSFAPGHATSTQTAQFLNPTQRYLPTKDGNTYCNYFTQDFMRARGVPNFPARNANDTNRWLNGPEARAQGWRSVDGDTAANFVSHGGVGVVSSPRPGHHGHIAPIIEGQAINHEPIIANAGSNNFASGPDTASPSFHRANTQFFIYDPVRP